jgi:hypothetical protein
MDKPEKTKTKQQFKSAEDIKREFALARPVRSAEEYRSALDSIAQNSVITLNKMHLLYVTICVVQTGKDTFEWQSVGSIRLANKGLKPVALNLLSKQYKRRMKEEVSLLAGAVGISSTDKLDVLSHIVRLRRELTEAEFVQVLETSGKGVQS